MRTKAWRTARKGRTDAADLMLTVTKPRMPPSSAEVSGSSAYLRSDPLATLVSAEAMLPTAVEAATIAQFFGAGDDGQDALHGARCLL